MTRTFHGTVHGQTIQIDEALGIADGEEVEVVVQRTKTSPAWGEGIRRSAGAAAKIPEFDNVFAQLEKERKAAKFREMDARELSVGHQHLFGQDATELVL